MCSSEIDAAGSITVDNSNKQPRSSTVFVRLYSYPDAATAKTSTVGNVVKEFHNYCLRSQPRSRSYARVSRLSSRRNKPTVKRILRRPKLPNVSGSLKLMVEKEKAKSKRPAELNSITEHKHSATERKRRADLRCDFLKLQSTIPELVNQAKVSKVSILSSAASLIKQLETNCVQLANELFSLRQRRVDLTMVLAACNRRVSRKSVKADAFT